MLAPLLSLALLHAAPTTTLLQPSGQLALQSGALSGPFSGDLKEAALGYALSRRGELGLPARATLVPGQAFSTRFGGSVQLEEQVDGLTVWGGRVVVTFDAQRRIVRLASSVKPFGGLWAVPTLDAAQALAVAARQIDGALLRPDGTPWGGTHAYAFVKDGVAHAGWLCRVITWRTSESWYVAVDGVTGAVLFAQNRAHASDGAQVYPSSPGGLSQGVGVAPLANVQLGHLVPTDGGFLQGDRISVTNCCPTIDCDAGAPARRAVGSMQTYGGVVQYDMAICDRRQRATNDPQVHASGDYSYAPVDPPTTSAPSITSPADYDEFAEVNAYFQVNKVYDFVEGLSQGPLTAGGAFSPFRMRDVGNHKLPAVWVNASNPDFYSATPNAQGVYVSNALSRTDNAMFVAVEQMQGLGLPELAFDSDALVIYQGNTADFAYDGPVLWHEFGHGVVYSTANWDMTVAFDARSANLESAALHEGVADVIAAMTGSDPVIGAYVGPRIDGSMNAIRDVDNAYRCPDILWGESHQDSMAFSGAIWEARTTTFAGSDQGQTFDEAFYAALVSFPPDVNFEKAATIVSAAVGQAFPAMSGAEQAMRDLFTRRGVLGCSKVVDVTDDPSPRPYYGLTGTALAQASPVPGPYQLKIHLPQGARRLSLSSQVYAYGSVRLQVLASAGQPITFTRAGSRVTHDATWSNALSTTSQGSMSGSVDVDVPCGGDLYFTLADTSSADAPLIDLARTVVPQDSCPLPPPPDPVQVQALPALLGPTAQGCGCTEVPPLGLLALLVPLALRRRRR